MSHILGHMLSNWLWPVLFALKLIDLESHEESSPAQRPERPRNNPERSPRCRWLNKVPKCMILYVWWLWRTQCFAGLRNPSSFETCRNETHHQYLTILRYSPGWCLAILIHANQECDEIHGSNMIKLFNHIGMGQDLWPLEWGHGTSDFGAKWCQWPPAHFHTPAAITTCLNQGSQYATLPYQDFKQQRMVDITKQKTMIGDSVNQSVYWLVAMCRMSSCCSSQLG